MRILRFERWYSVIVLLTCMSNVGSKALLWFWFFLVVRLNVCMIVRLSFLWAPAGPYSWWKLVFLAHDDPLFLEVVGPLLLFLKVGFFLLSPLFLLHTKFYAMDSVKIKAFLLKVHQTHINCFLGLVVWRKWLSCLEHKGASLSLMQLSKRVTILVLVLGCNVSCLFCCVIIHFILIDWLFGFSIPVVPLASFSFFGCSVVSRGVVWGHIFLWIIRFWSSISFSWCFIVIFWIICIIYF